MVSVPVRILTVGLPLATALKVTCKNVNVVDGVDPKDTLVMSSAPVVTELCNDESSGEVFSV